MRRVRSLQAACPWRRFGRSLSFDAAGTSPRASGDLRFDGTEAARFAPPVIAATFLPVTGRPRLHKQGRVPLSDAGRLNLR